MKPKPDCTGLRFGMLVVLGKGTKRSYKNTFIQLWQLRCDCGRIIEKPRTDFEHAGQVSCGCKRKHGLVDNKRRPLDISGQKFGNLLAIALTGKKNTYNKPTWSFQCDCGNTREMSLTDIRAYEHKNARINCRDFSNHPDRWLTYPPTPKPYPVDAGQLLAKYLPLTQLKYQLRDSMVEDELRDRLLRVAWIIVYRRSIGEQISELHETRIVRKHLRYCPIDVFWKRQLESQGGLVYDVDNKKREIGNTVTKLTSDNYPVIETQGIKMLPIKKFRFKRC